MNICGAKGWEGRASIGVGTMRVREGSGREEGEEYTRGDELANICAIFLGKGAG